MEFFFTNNACFIPASLMYILRLRKFWSWAVLLISFTLVFSLCLGLPTTKVHGTFCSDLFLGNT